ncbi:MAG TPA: TIGR02302 family protein [Xanthobacteraceae bacterium]|nr:TIGR02302 family protein [Xanthobacteraceae bacterium]
MYRPSGPDRWRARHHKPESAQERLARALKRAWWALTWERAWPRLALLVVTIGIFLALSWAGLWLVLPPLARAVGVGLVALLILASAVPLMRLSLPSRVESLARLDRESGIAHRPATAVSDSLGVGRSDKAAVALWEAHLARVVALSDRLRAGLPRPRLFGRDPYAVRALVLLLVVATFFVAGDERLRRLAAAFDWRGAVASANFRIDAWVTPPNYTGRPPILLPGVRPGEPVRQAAGPIAAPAGSVLVVRSTGISPDIAVRGLADATDKGGGRVPAGTEERRFIIESDGSVTLRGLPGRDVTWSFTAVPDKAPRIAFAKDPEAQVRGTLQLTYHLEDDYGVVHAEAKIARKPSGTASEKPARPLYEPPSFPLNLPQARTRNGTGETTKDLTQHPWAGTSVLLTLVARDEAGHVGQSEARELRLPQRPFYKPLARALVEQRRILAFDAEARGRVLAALDALTIAPERFIPEASIYLGLRTIYWNLASARSDDDLREVVDRLWAMAVNIEDGNVGDAEQALRQAEEALRQALERGASEEEIKRLMDELRAALDKFMQALAEEMRRNPQQLARPLDPNARELRPQDLRNMLDRIENLARSGNKEAARRLLEQLQSMLNNLQMARPGQQPNGDDMMSALDELGDMIRREQQLRDRTYRQGQERRNRQQGQPRQRGQQGQQGQQGEQDDSFGELRDRQQALREQLNRLMEQLKRRGPMQPGEQGEQGEDGRGALGEAEQAMRDAEEQLGQGDGEGAVESQGRAIESMRRGGQSLAQQMQNGPDGPGPNGQPGRTGRERAQQETDPLGRPLRGRDYGDDVTVKVPGEIDVQRARRILEELRRRLSDPLRPQIELDYIERLLKDF